MSVLLSPADVLGQLVPRFESVNDPLHKVVASSSVAFARSGGDSGAPPVVSEAIMDMMDIVAVPFTEAMNYAVDGLQSELLRRIPLLSRQQRLALLQDLVAVPVTAHTAPLVVAVLRTFEAPLDRAAIAAMSQPTALNTLGPEVVFSMGLPLRSVLWETAPTRVDTDLQWMLTNVLCDAVAASRMLNVVAGAGAAPKRLVNPALHELVASVRWCGTGGPGTDLYARACNLVAAAFLRTRDARLCGVRATLCALPLPVGGGSTSTLARAPPSRDPLSQLVLDCDRAASAAVSTAAPTAKGAAPWQAVVRSATSLARTALATRGDTGALQSSIRSLANAIHKHADSPKCKGGDGFLQPVVKLIPALAAAYNARIASPMDVGTMREKALARKYASLEELRADVALMVQNSSLFNGPDSPYTAVARGILDFTDAEKNKEAGRLSGGSAGAAGGGGSAARVAGFTEADLVVQLTMILADPHVTRAAVRCVLRSLGPATRSGHAVWEEPSAAAALAVLAVGDLAFTSMGDLPFTSISSPGAAAAEACVSTEAVLELLQSMSAAAPGGEGALAPASASAAAPGGAQPPTSITAVLRSMQNMLMAATLGDELLAPAATAAAGAAPRAPSGPDDQLAPVSLSAHVVALCAGGAHPHRRTCRMLLAAFMSLCMTTPSSPAFVNSAPRVTAFLRAAVACMGVPWREEALSAMQLGAADAASAAGGLLPASLGPPPSSAAACIVSLCWAAEKRISMTAPAAPAEPEAGLHPPGQGYASSSSSAAGAGFAAAPSPAATAAGEAATSLVRSIVLGVVAGGVLPALEAAGGVPWLVGLYHYELGLLLWRALERHVLLPTDASRLLQAALQSLARCAERGVTGPVLPGQPPTPPSALHSKCALVWQRPDFAAARSVYLRLVNAVEDGEDLLAEAGVDARNAFAVAAASANAAVGAPGWAATVAAAVPLSGALGSPWALSVSSPVASMLPSASPGAASGGGTAGPSPLTPWGNVASALSPLPSSVTPMTPAGDWEPPG